MDSLLWWPTCPCSAPQPTSKPEFDISPVLAGTHAIQVTCQANEPASNGKFQSVPQLTVSRMGGLALRAHLRHKRSLASYWKRCSPSPGDGQIDRQTLPTEPGSLDLNGGTQIAVSR